MLPIALLSQRFVNASELRQTPIVRAYQGVKDSVVNIHGRKTISSADRVVLPDTGKQINGMGTGVVIDPRGYIITNYHVVEGVPKIQVTYVSGTTVNAKLVAHDPTTDLAIIKVESEKSLPTVKMGTSSDLMPGETVIAVGNAYGYRHTVSQGIVSALHRPVQVSEEQSYADLIQTDAAINPGNSGGPLLNIDGEMIGINVAVRVGAQGIAFAIPVDEAMKIAANLLNAQRLGGVDHGVVGQSELENGRLRFVVTGAKSGSPAEAAGIQPGDEIASVGGIPVQRAIDVERAVLGHRAGDKIDITVNRGGGAETVSLTLNGSIQDRNWEILGLRLTPAPKEIFLASTSTFTGGMKVLEVRSGSPAFREGIRPGDILVGIHKWETASKQNLDYILDRADLADLQPMRFYVVRGSETLFGYLNVRVARR